jgi:hypothetical protein
MALYNTVALSSTYEIESGNTRLETTAAMELLLVGWSFGIMVNDVHISPTDIGIKRFFKLGTVFLLCNFLSVVTASGWI